MGSFSTHFPGNPDKTGNWPLVLRFFISIVSGFHSFRKMAIIVFNNQLTMKEKYQDLMTVLSTAEIQTLKDAYAYIAVLIAGADGKMDAKELAWAEKIVQIRSFSGDERLFHLHEEITKELPGKIKEVIGSMPADLPTRNKVFSAEIEKLNPILASLDPFMGNYMYKGYLSFAERTAKSSGGFLSFFAIGPEEKKWIKLPMLHAIAYNPDDEEEE
jgi:hypothetical protein